MYTNGKHLTKLSKFFCITKTGNIKLLRVTKQEDERFPRKYRELFRDSKANRVVVTTAIKIDYNCSISEAWNKLKYMVNGMG